MPDSPVVLAAISPDDQLVLRGNLTPDGLKHMAEDLSEAADEALVWPANDDAVHRSHRKRAPTDKMRLVPAAPAGAQPAHDAMRTHRVTDIGRRS